MIHLVTFATENMSRAARLCRQSCRDNGATTARIYRPDWISHWPEVKHNPFITQQPSDARRALGHWAWKPLIIDVMLRDALEGDFVIYSDAGIEFLNNVNYIIDRMDQDIFLFGNNWEHAHWCKRDILEAVWPDGPSKLIAKLDNDGYVLSGALSPLARSWDRFGKQVQASVIFFRVSDYTRKFVKEWLDWCLFEGGRLIDDSPSRTPNHPEFQENRHDQAILTTMAYREGLRLHWWPAVYNKGGSPEFVYDKLPEYANDDYPVLFSHHRKRNHEWSEAA